MRGFFVRLGGKVHKSPAARVTITKPLVHYSQSNTLFTKGLESIVMA